MTPEERAARITSIGAAMEGKGMTDIVTWLRHIATYRTPSDPRKACMEAADEIERLRQVLKNFVSAIDQGRPPHLEDYDEARKLIPY